MTEGGNEMVMPVAPMMGGYGNNGFGNWGSDIWVILLVLFACGGFGGFGGWGGMMNGFGGFGGMYEFPWLLNGQNGINMNTNAGFNQLATANSIDALRSSVASGFSDVQLGIAGVNQNICQSTGQVVQAVNNGFSQAEIANNARQMANMQQMFANQTAMNSGFNGLQSQLAQCCCDNRLATAQIGSDLAREACATRTADYQNTQALLSTFNNGIQSIKDQLCADKIEQKNDTIAQLRSELMYARGQASQDVQTAAIQLGQRNLANEVEQYVAPRAIPAYMVQNPNCCYPGYSCGCGAA